MVNTWNLHAIHTSGYEWHAMILQKFTPSLSHMTFQIRWVLSKAKYWPGRNSSSSQCILLKIFNYKRKNPSINFINASLQDFPPINTWKFALSLMNSRTNFKSKFWLLEIHTDTIFPQHAWKRFTKQRNVFHYVFKIAHKV